MTWAADYIGMPYRERGDTRDGANCWGLVRLVYREQLGIDLPAYDDAPDGSATKDVCRYIAYAHWLDRPRWKEVERPAPFDVALFRRGSMPGHVAVVVDAQTLLHTVVGCDAALMRAGAPEWWPRLIGFYRHRLGGQP